jgi:hypothetical protein
LFDEFFEYHYCFAQTKRDAFPISQYRHQFSAISALAKSAMSGNTNAWLRGQRKSDLVEIAENIGLKG